MSELNSQQQQGVETTKGYLLLLAGAGSGKTRVLVHRISHLITTCHVSPSSILALTFTNKAAGEMKQRIEKMIPSAQAKKLFLGTFHSFCMQLLRTEIHHLGFTSAFSLYDEKDMKRLMLQLGNESEGEESTLNKTLPHLLEAKREGRSIDQLPSIGSEEENLFFKKTYEKLLISLRAYNALDFDGLLFTTARLFEQFPEVLARYQERYLYIMIDEYQDTNVIQYKIADLLAKKHGNLCVVGDDDQSIYGWRGASIQNILSFPATTTIKLEQNYRSTPEIVEVANQLIKHNKLRHDKRLIPIQKSGDKVEIFHAPTEENEVEGVIARLLALREKEKLQWKEIAILYRSNKLAHHFELSL
ncbi:MAG: UvrD-helicase domain-containing protein, partial [Simkania negevensis]|nr:UvrD-helicase domain-containing protein [Simkania negevensis]